MGDRRSLTVKIMEASEAALEHHGDPWDIRGQERVRALAAQRTSAAQIAAIAATLGRKCIEMKHRGSVPARDGTPGSPCMRCRVKIKHYTEASEIVAPD